MKIPSIMLGCILGVLAILLIAGNASKPRPQTKYQHCVETAKHLRSDADTKFMVDAICERLPVEAADYR